MKRTFILIILIAFITPCTAQWKGVGSSASQVITFGVHDTSLFISCSQFVGRYIPTAPPGQQWVESDNGMGFGYGNFTSFASLGRYFFASAGSVQATYESSNDGAIWQETNENSVGSNGYYLFGITSHPFMPQPPYVVRSRDSGQTWDSVSNFNNGNWAVYFASIGRCILANNGGVIWRSQDTGNTWSQLSPPFVGAMTTMGSLLFITGGGNVIESTDSGTQWVPVAVDSGGTVPETVNVLVTDGKNLFAGTTKGVYLSTDIGKTWRVENQGLTSSLNVVTIGVFDTMLFINIPAGVSNSILMRSIPEMTDTTKSTVQASPPGDTIEIYPNPATGMVTIFAGSTAIIGVSMLNVLGLNVLDIPNPYRSDVTFDVSKLASGTYFVRIETAKGTVLRKITIER